MLLINININADRLDLCLKKLADGEVDELGYLYDNMAKPVYYLALSVLKDKSLAEDVLQDTFLKVYEKAESCQKNPRAWIMSIARNIALNKLKRSKHESTSFDYVEGALC